MRVPKGQWVALIMAAAVVGAPGYLLSTTGDDGCVERGRLAGQRNGVHWDPGHRDRGRSTLPGRSVKDHLDLA